MQYARVCVCLAFFVRVICFRHQIVYQCMKGCLGIFFQFGTILNNAAIKLVCIAYTPLGRYLWEELPRELCILHLQKVMPTWFSKWIYQFVFLLGDLESLHFSNSSPLSGFFSNSCNVSLWFWFPFPLLLMKLKTLLYIYWSIFCEWLSFLYWFVRVLIFYVL